MTDGIRFRGFSRIATVAILGVATGLSAHPPAAVPAGVIADIEPTPIPPGTTERELICMMLKILGTPCPPEDFPSYEDYYAQVEDAWMTADPNGFDPQQREDLLGATLDVKDSQTPAPAGVDPVAHDNFMLVLDEIIYEMGG